MTTTSDEPRLELVGLDGRNPLAFLAAIGALNVAARMAEQPVRLAWSGALIPRPVLTGVQSLDDLVEWTLTDRDHWHTSPALEFDDAKDIKFDRATLCRYLTVCREADDGRRSVGLAQALVAEESFDGQGKAKPTDLHFTAGQQQFLNIARTLRDGIDAHHVRAALGQRWAYDSTMPTFGWDVADDRIYALSATNPSKDTKYTVPGAEWLALMGLASFPSARGRDRTRTVGCFGTWKRGRFVWPIWSSPLALRTVNTLLAAGRDVGIDEPPRRRYSRSVDLVRVFASAIRRSEQGGYGTFGPPRVIWESP